MQFQRQNSVDDRKGLEWVCLRQLLIFKLLKQILLLKLVGTEFNHPSPFPLEFPGFPRLWNFNSLHGGGRVVSLAVVVFLMAVTTLNGIIYVIVQKNYARFWHAPIVGNWSCDAIVSLLCGRLLAHNACFWQFLLKI